VVSSGRGGGNDYKNCAPWAVREETMLERRRGWYENIREDITEIGSEAEFSIMASSIEIAGNLFSL
jgi:hypothetical protein